MPCTRASSAIAIRFCWIIVKVCGPLLAAMSLVPAKMRTAAGFSAMTSGYMRTSICAVVCPPMPRFTYGFPGKLSASRQPSVMESPMNTTRSFGTGWRSSSLLAW